MSKLTLEQVRDGMREFVAQQEYAPLSSMRRWADAIDAELKSRGEAVAEVMDELGFPIMTWLPTNVIDWPVGTKLYTAPPAPKIEVTEAMVEQASNKFSHMFNDYPWKECMRAALEAALKETP